MIEIKDNYFKGPDGNRYFRRNALAVTVGSHGEGKTPITEANYLAVEGNIKYVLLDGKIKNSSSVKIDWDSASKADVEAGVELYFDLGGVKLGFSHEKAIKARLELIRFYIDEGNLKRVLNNDANIVREKMKKEGADARVCASTWVVMSGELAQRFNTSAGLEVSGTVSEGLTITAKGGGAWSGSEKITFSQGTVFGYGLYKVKKWNGDIIEDMEDDWQGLN
jgi:hypothetical protein